MVQNFRIDQLRGRLNDPVKRYLDHYTKININAKQIQTATLRSNLQDGRTSIDSQVEALAICIWLQKNGHSIEVVCYYPDLVKRLATKVYTLQRACNVIDNQVYKKVGLYWHDLFPRSLPSKGAMSKLVTLAAELRRWCPPGKTKVDMRGQLIELLKDISYDPKVSDLAQVLKDWRAQNKIRIGEWFPCSEYQHGAVSGKLILIYITLIKKDSIEKQVSKLSCL